MATDQYGAAQPIMDWVRDFVYNPVRVIGRTIDRVPDPSDFARTPPRYQGPAMSSPAVSPTPVRKPVRKPARTAKRR